MSVASLVCAGRAPALAVLNKQLAQALRGTARIVWIEGEPGLGKTTLVRAFLAEGSHRAVWASGDEAETRLSYGVLTSLNASIRAALGGPKAPDPAPVGSTDPLTAGAELLVSLGAQDDPLVMVIDDLQWADGSSASALRFALRRLLAEPLLVILITRPNPGDLLGDAWERLLADTERIARVHLDGLTTDGMSELLEATGHGHLGRTVAVRLGEHTGGSPLHARALIEELGDSGLQATRVLPAPRSFAQLTVGRLAALGDDVSRFVSAGAVLGLSFPVVLAASVAGLSDTGDALDRAMAAGLLQPASDGEVAFTHPLVRGAVYNDIQPSTLRALHQAAAELTSGARSLEHRVVAATGPDEDLAHDLDRRAFQEWASGRGSNAYRHFMAASTLSSDVPARERRLFTAIEAIFSTGDYARAHAMRKTVKACTESAHRSYILGMLDTRPQAADCFTAAAAEADDETDVPFLRLRAIGGRAIVHLQQGRFEAALDDAKATMAPGVEGWASGLMRWVQVVSLANLGRTAEARDMIERRLSAGSSVVELDDLCARGLLEFVDDDLPAAVEDLTAVAERVRGGQTCRVLHTGLSVLAAAQYRLGHWDESALNIELAIALYSEEQRPRVTVAHAVAALVHAGRGRFDLAEADIRAAEQADRDIPFASGPYFVALARAVLAQARGQLDELRLAVAPLLEGHIRPSIEGLDPWGWRVLAIEGLLGAGELDLARRHLTDLTEIVHARGWESPKTDMARIEGELAERSGDVDAALATYAAGAPTPGGRPPLPLPAARLALAHGSLLRRTGARRPAIEVLRTAHAGFSALGAEPFLAMCDTELSACGLQTPSPDAFGRLQLTPAEQAVAHLIAQGLTNREAATRLYVSPKTVDYHLGNIYAKLGITSRRDLARRLTPD